MEEVNLAGFFQFLSDAGKNIVNFLTPGPEIFPTKAPTTTIPSEPILPEISLKDAFAKEYNMFNPTTIPTPAPEPAGTPFTLSTKLEIPSLTESFLQQTAPSLPLPTLTSPTTFTDITKPFEVPSQVQSAFYRVEHGLPLSAKVPSTSSSWLSNILDVLKWGTDTFLQYYQTKQSMDYASKMAEAEIESQKAAQAIAEAQARIAQSQAQSQAYQRGISNLLSKEALKKYAPYFIPIAIGLVVAMVLVAKGKEK